MSVKVCVALQAARLSLKLFQVLQSVRVPRADSHGLSMGSTAGPFASCGPLTWAFLLKRVLMAPSMADSAGRKGGRLVRCLALTKTPGAQGKCFRGSLVRSSRPSYTFGFFHLKSELCCITSNMNCECERRAGLVCFTLEVEEPQASTRLHTC